MTFRTRVLERCFLSVSDAQRKWGPIVASKYVQRITVLRSTPGFDDLFAICAFRLHPLKGDRQGDYAITIHGQWRLIVTLGETVDRLIVKEVSDHYDD